VYHGDSSGPEELVESKDKLVALLESIFEDGIVEVSERQALAALTATLDAATVSSAFRKFLNDKWGEAIADDILTGQERALLGRIVHELNLAPQDIPAQARMALKD
jgi:hypothetical protein